MTRDDIIRIARKAGFTDSNGFSELIVRHSNGSWVDVSGAVSALVQLAYTAGAAAEREACARICDATPPYPFRPSIEAAHAIRSRGQS